MQVPFLQPAKAKRRPYNITEGPSQIAVLAPRGPADPRIRCNRRGAFSWERLRTSSLDGGDCSASEIKIRVFRTSVLERRQRGAQCPSKPPAPPPRARRQRNADRTVDRAHRMRSTGEAGSAARPAMCGVHTISNSRRAPRKHRACVCTYSLTNVAARTTARMNGARWLLYHSAVDCMGSAAHRPGPLLTRLCSICDPPG